MSIKYRKKQREKREALKEKKRFCEEKELVSFRAAADNFMGGVPMEMPFIPLYVTPPVTIIKVPGRIKSKKAYRREYQRLLEKANSEGKRSLGQTLLDMPKLIQRLAEGVNL